MLQGPIIFALARMRNRTLCQDIFARVFLIQVFARITSLDIYPCALFSLELPALTSPVPRE
ncbi:hypothetical protein DBV39_05660 [Orrella marina]|uniref:Uncharacterized protein n=1 Tax=Orrella marina TaxID=2163011 RepID=A0A2R4XHI9_9BURK|nr:hypothetical protein DBV39_05660 [Orrella marina]